MPSRARFIVEEALALHESHPHAPAVDMLDLAMQRHQVWLEDFFEHMVPPSPFALLVAEAMGDSMSSAEWSVYTGPGADEKVRDATREQYATSVWPKFVKRYGFSHPVADAPITIGGMPRWM